MKYIRKHLYYIVFTALAVIIAALGLISAYSDLEVNLYFESEAGTEEINIYESENGYSYAFLPAFVALEDMKFNVPFTLRAYIDGNAISSGDSCKDVIINHEYQFTVNNRSTTLVFCRSSNIASFFIDTSTGTMEHIHQDQQREENAAVRLYSSDGTLGCSELYASIKGRGNTTWWYDFYKKPYVLTFPSQESLLEMPPSIKWILLANTEDESHLRNKIVFDTANSLIPGFAPESRYVDLYLNGEYAGLYLLTEKVGLDSNLPELDVNNGEFLCSIEIASRVSGFPHSFETATGRSMEIVEPQNVSSDEALRIQSLVNTMEAAIFSGNASTLVNTLDIDSWATRYLIDEVFANVDSDNTSSYFSHSDGVFRAGPVWDYDLSFGDYLKYLEYNRFYSYPSVFICKDMPYNSALLSNEAFRERMVELYCEKVLPLVSDLALQGLENQYSLIEDSVKMNALRFGHTDVLATPVVQEMCDYLSARIDFLSSAWIDGKEYCSVDFYYPSGDILLYTAAERGTTVNPDFLNTTYPAWVDTYTGEIFDFSQPILSDISLRAVDAVVVDTQATGISEQLPADSAPQSGSLSLKKVVVLFSGILFISFFILLLTKDIRHTYERER